MLNAVEHANFFENRATEYSKASTTGTWEEAFAEFAGLHRGDIIAFGGPVVRPPNGHAPHGEKSSAYRPHRCQPVATNGFCITRISNFCSIGIFDDIRAGVNDFFTCVVFQCA